MGFHQEPASGDDAEMPHPARELDVRMRALPGFSWPPTRRVQTRAEAIYEYCRASQACSFIPPKRECLATLRERPWLSRLPRLNECGAVTGMRLGPAPPAPWTPATGWEARRALSSTKKGMPCTPRERPWLSRLPRLKECGGSPGTRRWPGPSAPLDPGDRMGMRVRGRILLRLRSLSMRSLLRRGVEPSGSPHVQVSVRVRAFGKSCWWSAQAPRTSVLLGRGRALRHGSPRGHFSYRRRHRSQC